ncbi:arabinose ABC transporter permease [Rhodococcus sp. SRB_17]|uniref:MFS transporter n=1 Tax=Rhodococcus sp. OK302 TaxID=1882769 RepID=UPI000B93F564|nr:MFS transporter [Rhodococcus sp. OK302]NMM89191.1 arabinose ABC transporter permease [Rhodococcus sp. SRB_17]OYD61196.1 putative MFS family arabinose efflux permease [Rhodococcus sp. OK302]OYD70447.1 putative MFS family arabinose efflux permease [Rhodococcus sp. OK302]
MKSKLLIPVLALGVFGIITTEMGIIGVLPQISEKFGISTSSAGWLVGVFALVVAVTGPFMTLVASGINRKTVLLVAIAVFAVSNLVYATTSSFEVMFAFRIIPAVAHPVFFAVALASAVRSVPPEKAAAATTKVFAGVTVGFAFGVPLTSYLAENFSVSTAFVFGAGINVLAFVGIMALLPSSPVTQQMSYGAQVGILRRPRVWLTVISVMFVFSAMFSVYGYFAEYLGDVTGMSGSWISAMLLAFGVVMIFGNFVFGAMLGKSVVRTVVAFPVLYVVVYVLIYLVGPHSVPMIVGVLIWGVVHSGGLVVSQSWMGRDAVDAPEFGNSLFISFSNLGITVGTMVGGWFLGHLGTRQLVWAGVLFAVLGLMTITARLALGGVHRESGARVPV